MLSQQSIVALLYSNNTCHLLAKRLTITNSKELVIPQVVFGIFTVGYHIFSDFGSRLVYYFPEVHEFRKGKRCHLDFSSFTYQLGIFNYVKLCSEI